MVREGYKETELGEIPEDWRIVELSSLINESKEKSFPPHNFEKYIGLEHIDSGKFKLTKFESSNEIKSNCSVFDDENILYGKLRPYLDKAVITSFKGICSTEIIVINSNESTLNNFIINHLHDQKFINYSVKNSFGTKMPRTSINLIGGYTLGCPPLPEQHRIAAVLSTIDETIEKTECLIEKLKMEKAGLMADLLTKGIDEDGRVRSEETHEFYDSEIGRVPVGWEVVRGFDLFDIGGGNNPSDVIFENKGNCLFLKVDAFNILENKYSIKCSSQKFSYEKNEHISIYPPDSIVFPKRGAAIFLNRVNIIKKHCAVDPNIMVLKIKGEIDSIILKHYLLYLGLFSICDNSGLPQINNKHIYPLSFPLPPLTEQHRIASVLTAAENRIEKEEAYRDKLLTMKKGLMADLLTGKVRVLEGVKSFD